MDTTKSLPSFKDEALNFTASCSPPSSCSSPSQSVLLSTAGDSTLSSMYPMPVPVVQQSVNAAGVAPLGPSANLQFEHQLADEIRMHRCIYDSKALEYRDRSARYAAWSEIIAKLGIVSVEAGEQLFTNLRKRYSKKRQDMKKALKFGSREEAEKALAEFEKYKFVSWIEEHMKIRTSKTEDAKFSSPSFTVHPLPSTQDVELHLLPVSPHPSFEREGQADNCVDATFADARMTCPGNQLVAAALSTRHDTRPASSLDGYRANIRESLVPGLQGSKQAGQTRVGDSPCVSQQRQPGGKAPLNLVAPTQEACTSRGAQHSAHGRNQTDAIAALRDLDDDELFGTMVTLELRKLGKRDKCLLKREINETMFRAQLRMLDDSELSGKSVSSSGAPSEEVCYPSRESRRSYDGSESFTRSPNKRSKIDDIGR